VKRIALVMLLAAACGSSPPRTPLQRTIRKQLGGDATIERSDLSRAAYLAYRDERMKFELDAKGMLTRTEIDIPRAALPTVVRAAFPMEHGYTATVVFANGTVTFMIRAVDDERDWVIDANGTVLSHTRLGPDCCDD
jgi:hypothetical protein